MFTFSRKNSQMCGCVFVFAASVRHGAYTNGFIERQAYPSAQAVGVWKRRLQPHWEGGRVCMLMISKEIFVWQLVALLNMCVFQALLESVLKVDAIHES